MSFTFSWPRFSDQFHADAIQMLTAALNKGNKPPVIADRIEVVELEMGTQPPELEIRDIGELTVDQFRGIFRLSYSGDAHIVLRTKVQANPLNHKQPDIHLLGGSRGMLAAKQPLVVPMNLRLSHFKLNSYVVLVVSRQKGITLVFKTDPLQNVDINSTFDSIAVIQKFIQREIEGQLRQMFREDLPGIIHRLSQQWVKAKVEAPYLSKRPTGGARQREFDTMSMPDTPLYRIPHLPSMSLQQSMLRQPHGLPTFGRARTASVMSGTSVSSAGRRPSSSIASTPTTPAPTPAPDNGMSSFPEIENYDPTYGLRPEGLPAKSVFNGFRSLFTQSKGLADLAEDADEVDDSADDTRSFDTGTWDEFLSDYDPPPPSAAGPDDDEVEYESVPAVGGGTITRPRVYHSQSQIQPSISGPPTQTASPRLRPAPSIRTSASRRSAPRLPLSALPTPSGSHYGSSYNPYFAVATPLYGGPRPLSASVLERSWSEETLNESPLSASIPPVPSLYRSPSQRPSSPSSMLSQPSRSSDMTHPVVTPPAFEEEAGIHIDRPRRLSLTSSNLDRLQPGSPSEQQYMPDHDPKIVLRPTANNSISKLSTLSHSNHTLSPYTRTLEHYTVRSVPPRDATSCGPASSVEKPPVRAKRKRIHHLGGKPAKPDAPQRDPSASPRPQLSEFDASEMDRYFRANDDLIPFYPDHLPSPNARRHFPYQS